MRQRSKVYGLRSLLCGLVAVVCLLAFVVSSEATDSVLPPTCTFTNARGEAVGFASPESYYKTTTLVFTNCKAFAAGTNGAVQGLDGVTIEMRVGDLYSSTAYTGTVQVATSGTWSVRITVPTNYVTTYLQTKLTDSETNIYIYPMKMLKTIEPLD